MIKTVGRREGWGGDREKFRIQIRRLRWRVGLGGAVIARCSEHPKEESAFVKKGFRGKKRCVNCQKVR